MHRAAALVALIGAGCPSRDRAAPPGEPSAELGAGGAAAPGTVVPPGLRLPDGVSAVRYQLALELDPELDRFGGRVELALELAAPADHVWLHAVELELGAIEVVAAGVARAGAVVPSDGDEMIAIDLGGRVPAGAVALRIAYTGAYHDRDMVGLFRVRDGRGTYIFSQLEAVQARKVVPCLDEPRFKAPWQVTLDIPRGLVAVGNAAVARREVRGDRELVELAPTDPLPPYLVAIAVGPFATFELGTVGRRRLPLRVIAPAGARPSRAAHAGAVVSRVVTALEAYLGQDLPYAKLDLVAVPGFPGAMENPGLVTFDTEILLAPEADARAGLVEIAAHEIAHQWFGNSVTLAWWDDLWLSESVATWLGAKIAADLDPGRDVALAHHVAVEAAMVADALPGAAALRRTVTTNADIEAAFDVIAYDKGAAVLAMFEAWLGEAKLKAAMRAYVEAHAGGVTDAADFLDAIERASDAGARGALATFMDQPGVPLISIERSCERIGAGGGARIAITQERLVPAGSATPVTSWRVPVCIRYAAPRRAGLGCAMLAGPSAELILPASAGCPAWVVGNADARGYYRVRGDAALIPAARKLSPRERLGAAGDAAALIVAGRGDPEVVAALAAALIATGAARDEHAALELVAATAGVIDDRRRDAWRRWATRLVAPVLARTRVEDRAPGDPARRDARADRIALAALVLEDPRVIGEAGALAARWVDGQVDLPADELALVLAAAARGADLDFAHQLIARRDTVSGLERDAVVAALGHLADPDAARAAIAAIVEPDDAVAAEAAVVLGGLASRGATRGLVLDQLRDHRAELLRKLPQAEAANALIAPFAAICELDDRGRVLPVLEALARDLDGGPAAFADAVAEIDRCIARRAALAARFDLVLGP